jgi:hypothetical protein
LIERRKPTSHQAQEGAERLDGVERIPIDGDIGYVVTLPDGRIASIYTEHDDYHDLREERPEKWSFLRHSSDGGRTWTDPTPSLALPAGPGAASAVMLAIDKRQRLHMLGLRYFGLEEDGLPLHSHILHASSDDWGASWSTVKAIDYGHPFTGALNGMTVLESGRIVVPFSYNAPERESGQYLSMTVYSDDGGETWGRSNSCAVDAGGKQDETGALEPVVIQLRGGLVWLIIRTVTGYFWESFSIDGATWTPARQTRIVSSNAPAGVLRLADGRLVLSWNNLYGEPFRGEGISYARQQLHAAISTDEGQTWSVPKVIAQKAPDEPLKTQTTYPYLCEAPDGKIVVVYHRVYSRPGNDWKNTIHELVRVDPNWLAS